jgi:hypothetical protein
MLTCLPNVEKHGSVHNIQKLANTKTLIFLYAEVHCFYGRSYIQGYITAILKYECSEIFLISHPTHSSNLLYRWNTSVTVRFYFDKKKLKEGLFY